MAKASDQKNIDKSVEDVGKDRELTTFERYNQKQIEKQEELLYKLKVKWLKKGITDEKKLEELAQKDIAKIQTANLKKTRKERLDAIREEREARIEALQDELETALTNEEKKAARRKLDRAKNAQAFRESAKEAGSAIAGSLLSGATKGAKEGISIFADYMSGIEARVQGSGLSFQGMLKTIKRNTVVSPYVRQATVIENLSKLVSQGIAYNVEQRAFLETISDKIATTFDATNGTLLRLIRIQQADTTASRLGLEADLTRYLNQTYKDTSYLSDQFDNVSASLYEATAIAGRNIGVELEYVTQKWLGSLYSVGASDQLISNLAQGIGYLGSGNISALSSNEALMNLFTMAASRTGADIASILTGGLSSQTANTLLKGVVQYVQEIGRNENLAVRSEYANIFGMTISDMTALLNLSSKDLDEISKNMLTYSKTIDEVEYQLDQVGKRTHLSELIDNVLANASLTLGINVASNAVTYGIYKAGEMIDELTGGLKLPTVSVLGSSIDLGMTYGQLLQAPVLGVGAAMTLVNALSSIGSRGGLNLKAWNASDYNVRGTGISPTTYGVNTGVSSSAVVGGSQDTLKQSLAGAEQEAQNISGETQQEPTKIETNVADILEVLSNMYTLLDNVARGVSSFRVTSLYDSSTM